MKTIIVLIFSVALGPVACGDDSDPSGRTSVVAGFYPLAYAAEEIGGDQVEVTNLTPAGAEPHDLELGPRDLEEILGANLVVYVGGGFQPAVEEAIDGSDVPAVDVLGSGDDPHVWLDPVRFAQVVERIGTELAAEARARDLASRLRALDEDYRQGLADCEGRELVTTHDAFGHLAQRYGLEVIPVTGLSPEAEPSPQDLEEAAELVEARGVTTVFTEPLLSPEIGETVAREAGATTAELNPLEGLTEDELARGEDYFTVMEANLQALREGLGCR
ncbi:MAG: metal ABC transporter substrate-binding protein [Gaiellaceae bacterium]